MNADLEEFAEYEAHFEFELIMISPLNLPLGQGHFALDFL
jgi:hypothetical protein